MVACCQGKVGTEAETEAGNGVSGGEDGGDGVYEGFDSDAIWSDDDQDVEDAVSLYESVVSSEGEGDGDGAGSEQFVVKDPLEQCFHFIGLIKSLFKQKKWEVLLDLLRRRVVTMLVSEDALRRSGIGRIISKVARHAKDYKVQMAANEVLTEWQSRVGFRDLAAERETETERMERIKFEEFMQLPAINVRDSANGRSGSDGGDGGGGDVGVMEWSTALEPAKGQTFEKRISLIRETDFSGIFTRPLGFELNIRPRMDGGITAVVAHIEPDSVAVNAGREGCRLELNDEVVEINDTKLQNLDQESFMAMLKTKKMDLVLEAFVPGAEHGGETNEGEEDQGLYRHYKVTNDDLIAFDDPGMI